ncbi:M23 family metallopeptidase [Lutibacter sp. B2]|nr:M23 family metallopeptidase [Lutibacter sp. B2]
MNQSYRRVKGKNAKGFVRKNNSNIKKPFYKKMIKQIVWCIIIISLVILFKNINTSITNTALDIMKDSINNEIDVKKTTKQIVEYVKEVPKLSNKVVNVFNDFSDKKDIKMNFIPPIDGEIISHYGKNVDPILETNTFQRGIDIVNVEDKEVVSIADGVIIETGESKNFGKYIKVKHSNDVFSLYGNCSNFLIEKGKRVKRGQHIATVFSASENKNSHLHFELWIHGNVVDPTHYISFDRKII